MGKELRKLLKEHNASEHPYDSDQFTISIQDIQTLLETEFAYIFKSMVAALMNDELNLNLEESRKLLLAYLMDCKP